MFKRKLPGVPTPSPPPDNRVLANAPMMVRRSIMPIIRGGMKRPVRYM